MHSYIPYTATARRSNAEEILDMVDRGCRMLMRAGGGPLEHDKPNIPQLESDPHPDGARRFVGRSVSFDDPAGGSSSRRLVGMVEAASYTGRTVRGAIPDYSLTIRGQTGKRITVSLVESHASIS